MGFTLSLCSLASSPLYSSVTRRARAAHGLRPRTRPPNARETLLYFADSPALPSALQGSLQLRKKKGERRKKDDVIAITIMYTPSDPLCSFAQACRL